MKNLHPETICVHEGTFIEPNTEGMTTPIYNSTSFGYIDKATHAYPRYFNTVNQQVVADKLVALEKGEAGMIFSSGMAAISTAMLALLQAGDHVILQNDLYGGTFHFVVSQFPKYGITYSLVESDNPQNFAQAIQSNTKLIYIETPSNPLLKITDIQAVAKIAKAKNLLTMIDNTFASPINQNPILLGIDVVIHSGTKYLGGHSDICCGAVISSKAIIQKVYESAICFGGSLNAETCYLLERSLKTLSIRIRQHNENALKIAQYLENHPKINQVYYPGLPNHPNHALAKEQMAGFGGMLSFEINPEKADYQAFLKKLTIIHPAMSLGGVESLMCVSAETSHAKMTREERLKIGIKDELIRFSVGIENAEDLIADLKQALG